MNINSNTVKLALAAMFAAFICVATMIIKIPTFATSGYVNIGDAMILLTVWILGGTYAALAAGIGSALADLLCGYTSYAPGTFVIKFAMAFAAFMVFKALTKLSLNKFVTYIISAVVAEAIMIGGYLAYEWTLLGYGAGALPSVVSNLGQGVTCGILAVVAIAVLDVSKVTALINKYKEA